MEIKIQNQKQNILLEREEIKGIISNEKTISKVELQKAIAEQTKKPTELIAIKSIYPSYGSHKANFEVFIYNTQEALKKIEPKTKEKTEKKAKAPEQAPTQTAAKPAEAAKPEEKK